MKMKLGRRWVLVAPVLLCGLLASPSSGKDKQVDTWNARIQETVLLLRSGQASQARAVIAPVLEEMTQSVNPSKGSARAFGLALMLRGLAEAGEGHEREATWDWHMAQQIDPALESWDLTEFGAAGAMLDRHRLAKDPVPETPEDEMRRKAGGDKPEAASRGREMFPPDSHRAHRWKSPIVLSTRVDADGVPTYPRIVKKPEELDLVLVASEYVRETRFKPLLWEGRPIAFLYAFRLAFEP